LTGSIGVIFGKVNLGSFLEDIVGVRIDQTRAYGKNALMVGPVSPHASHSSSPPLMDWIDGVE